ncbi:MAG: dihydropteroate synthase [Vicingaceae bacterium]
MDLNFASSKDTIFYKKTSINCKGNLLNLDEPKVMGILNLTPDSFFDGGTLKTEADIILRVENMLKAGADIIDIGGMSSRPGAKIISIAEEIKRVTPVISLLTRQFKNIIISVDTFRHEVAEKALHNGASIINDISGGKLDKKMLDFVAINKVPYILMHMQGTPETMQQNPHYKNVVLEVAQFFSTQLDYLYKHGANDIILDPGFGFGKTLAHNYSLLKHLSYFKQLFGLPLLAGVSRKSMINKVLNTSPKEALNGTTVLNTIALLNGADILRVHDVKEAKECVGFFVN